MNLEQARAYSWDKYRGYLAGITSPEKLREICHHTAQQEGRCWSAMERACKEREFWQGKFNTVRHENNQLRKRNRSLTQDLAIETQLVQEDGLVVRRLEAEIEALREKLLASDRDQSFTLYREMQRDYARMNESNRDINRLLLESQERERVLGEQVVTLETRWREYLPSGLLQENEALVHQLEQFIREGAETKKVQAPPHS